MVAACAGQTDAASSESEGEVDVAVAAPGARIAPKIMGGAADPESDHRAVVALRVGEPGSYDLCSGALVAPNVVLTARHCVVESVTSTVACDEHGKSANGAHVDEARPRSVALFLGAEPDFKSTPDARGARVIAPTGDSLCDSDIALVVLDHALEGVRPFAVRIGAGIATGEKIKTVGYGANDREKPLGTRLRKDGMSVLAKGSGISKYRTALGPHEFEVGLSICQGDSGGPAISETTGAVIGVVSRGGACDDEFGHVYTTTSGWQPLFQQAFEAAGETPLVEPDSDEASETASSGAATAAREASCSTSSGRRPTGLGALLLLGAAIAAAIRRR